MAALVRWISLTSAGFHRITCLTLSNVHMVNFNQLRSLLCAFASLEELSFEDVLLSEDRISRFVPIPARFWLRILRIAARTRVSEVALRALVWILAPSLTSHTIWKSGIAMRSPMALIHGVYQAFHQLVGALRDSLRCPIWDDPTVSLIFMPLELPNLTHLELRGAMSLSLGRPRVFGEESVARITARASNHRHRPGPDPDVQRCQL
ncbi:uncharacterized protein C8Q71DRAFT_478454 [Rhodofomes roseus]|uniref:Uncharacterized protein n=1 Tax=Rhodofomes roseus TaxID=34475 RepID=A0ABQ8KNW5_9APHY|nr:uncharacterized protein C8Q71DRAFT_478454 [Rhodofomes roseus]KAH9840124.1 hypothetical protein C8Q71DRAFT_478454 [Rhodofomes roseus]